MRKKLLCLLLVMVMVFSSTGIAAFASQPDRTYTYEGTTAVPSTNIYQVKTIIDETTMGVERMLNPTDIFVDKNDRVFILDEYKYKDENKKDKTAGRIIILDKDYNVIRELKDFKYGLIPLKLGGAAEGLFFREANQSLYIADTQNNRILVSDIDGNVSKIFGLPKDELLDKAKSFKPQKLIVDNMGIMYVVSGDPDVGINGAMMIDQKNNFLGFYGTNKLKMTAAMKIEFFWRSILTDAQNAQSTESYQPVAFSNIFWSEDRFVYGVSPIIENMESNLVKLNALGKNVFPQNIDMYSIMENSKKSKMTIVDITVDDEGAFTVIDAETGRLYQYDENCNLLAVFGGKGYQKGLFGRPVSLESDSQNNLLILDADKCTVTVMEQTYYGQKIREANNLYNEGRYKESIEPWRDVLRMNANYTRAYVGMGKACLAMDNEEALAEFGKGKYEQAMEFFMSGKDQDGYAEAKAGLRDEIVRKNFGLVAAVVIAAMVLILGYDQIKNIIGKIAWMISRRKGE